jgi:two-component system sensor histidine kinase UhpB
MDNILRFNPANGRSAVQDYLSKGFEARQLVDARPLNSKSMETFGRRRSGSERRQSAASQREALVRAADIPPGTAPGVAVERRVAQAELERSHRDLQKIVAALDSLREEEQRRLAHDMHDDLGQLLAAMKIDLSNLRQRVPRHEEELLQPLNNLGELVETMVVSVRRIIADLPPKVLEDFGLFCALEILTANFQKRHGIAIRLLKPSPEPLMRSSIKTPVYRMIQEALNNIAKHARATEVDVVIECRHERIALSVRDNGTGLAPDSLQKPDSFGLLGMRQRTVALGGDFGIRNIPGSGTEISIAIPLRIAGSSHGA